MATGINAQIQQNLQAALAANALALSKMYANPRPDGSVDGTSNQWTAMRMALLKEQQELLIQIQNCDIAWESVSYGR